MVHKKLNKFMSNIQITFLDVPGFRKVGLMYMHFSKEIKD